MSATAEAAGYANDVVVGGARALENVDGCDHDLALVEWFLSDVDGTAVVRALRKRTGPTPFIVLVAPLTEEAARVHAMRCGADELLSRPFTAQTLRHALRRAPKAERTAERSQEAASPFTSSQRILFSNPFWSDFGSYASSLLSDFIGEKVEISAPDNDPAESLRLVAALDMLDVSSLLEVRVSLSCSRVTAGQIARAMGVKAADEPALRDMLAEACNVMLGRAKATFRSSGLRFTLALPSSDARKTAEFPAHVSARLTGSCGVVTAALAARPSKRLLVRTSELRANMILAQDLRDDRSDFALAAGTRLNAADVDRVVRYFPLRQVLVSKVFSWT
jgi:CheY-like chemotaxis protein